MRTYSFRTIWPAQRSFSIEDIFTAAADAVANGECDLDGITPGQDPTMVVALRACEDTGRVTFAVRSWEVAKAYDYENRHSPMSVEAMRGVYSRAMAQVAYGADTARGVNAVAFDLGMSAYRVTYQLWLACTMELRKA